MKMKEVEALLVAITVDYMMDSRTTPESSGALGEVMRTNMPDEIEEGFLEALRDGLMDTIGNQLGELIKDATKDA